MNKQLLGMDIDQTQKMDGQWFKLTNALMETSCDTLRSKVLGRIKTWDLNNVQIQLHRIGGVPWDSLSAEDVQQTMLHSPAMPEEARREQLSQHRRSTLEKPNVFMARILIEYEIQ